MWRSNQVSSCYGKYGQRYLNATATELAIMDRVCIICREEMARCSEMLHWLKLFVLLLVLVAAVGVAGAGGVAHRMNPQHSRKRLSCGKSQAPVQPAIVNPVAAVNPIAINVNDNVPQPAGAYIHTSIHKHCLLQIWDFLVDMEWLQAPIYLITLGPAPFSDANASGL
ncbi:hypothetical protein BASA83_005749 [Batrachochytrium salamandrivorans]|nr:hypothetical protein BASA83_005749 [Batrachochytrium salamandrivorans]